MRIHVNNPGHVNVKNITKESVVSPPPYADEDAWNTFREKQKQFEKQFDSVS